MASLTRAPRYPQATPPGQDLAVAPGRGPDQRSSWPDRQQRSATPGWRARGQQRREQPFASIGRRLRSMVGLVILVAVLGAAVAGAIIAAMVALVLAGSHLLGG